MNTDAFPNSISSAIEPLRVRLLEHPLHARLQTLANPQVFIEHPLKVYNLSTKKPDRFPYPAFCERNGGL